jgi:hypothetical protein
MSENDLDFIFDDLDDDTKAEAGEDALARVRKLAELLVRQEDEVKNQAEMLAHAKSCYNQTRLQDLPGLLKEVGLPGLKLEDGTQIDLKQEIDASITKEKRAAAHAWLEANGFGGLIKTKVLVEFPKDKREDAIHCVHDLSEEYDTVSLDDSVHPGTFKSFVKEQMEKGTALPQDLFSIHPYDVATVKRVKK